MANGGDAVERGDVLSRDASSQVVLNRIDQSKRVWLVGYPESTWHIARDPIWSVGRREIEEDFQHTKTWSFGAVAISLYRAEGTSD